MSQKKPQPEEIKVLRVGVVVGGKMVEERKLRHKESVSFGTSDKATFRVSAQDFPKSLDVFEHTGTAYQLHVTPDMTGTIQFGYAEEVRDFNLLRQRGTKKGNEHIIAIPEDARGKIYTSGIQILFQFVEVPRELGPGELPPEIKGTILSQVDIQFASILVGVAISMVSMASYAMSQPYVEPSTIAEIAEQFQKIIMPDRVPEVPTEDKGADEGDNKEKEKPKVAKAAPKKTKGDGESKGPADAEAAARARKEAIKGAVAGKGLLGVIGKKGAGGALADVFSDGGFGEGQLSEAFSGIQGVDLAGGAGEKGTRGGGAGESAGIGDLGTEGGGSVSSGSKTETAVSGTIERGTPEVDGDLSTDVIEKEMKTKVKALKDCYDRELKRFPKLSGKIVLAFEILETGRVSNVAFNEDTLGSRAVKDCVIERAKRWTFPKPEGGSVFVAFPLVLAPSS
ncbi:MAG: AgmX/PglI C-terminal domain-containing protein [Deltaproteobacteria bacterium]|nr:AgmX/PglI C-terminal domain-containing protein [Deltaproteobacteria bacterium]